MNIIAMRATGASGWHLRPSPPVLRPSGSREKLERSSRSLFCGFPNEARGDVVQIASRGRVGLRAESFRRAWSEGRLDAPAAPFRKAVQDVAPTRNFWNAPLEDASTPARPCPSPSRRPPRAGRRPDPAETIAGHSEFAAKRGTLTGLRAECTITFCFAAGRVAPSAWCASGVPVP